MRYYSTQYNSFVGVGVVDDDVVVVVVIAARMVLMFLVIAVCSIGRRRYE